MKQTTLLILIAIIALPIFAQAQFNKYPIPYRKGDKWGYCDEKKNIIVEPIYDEADAVLMFKHLKNLKPLGRITKDNKIGYINAKGKMQISPTYTNVKPRSDEKYRYFFLVSDEHKKYGIVSYDVLDKIIVPLEYDYINTHQRNNILGEKGGNLYSINPFTGASKFLSKIEDEGEGIEFMPYDSGYSRTSTKSKPKSYNLTIDEKSNFKKKHAAIFSEIIEKPFRQKRAFKREYPRNEKSYFKIVKDGKYGVIEREELNKSTIENFIAPQYDEIIDARLVDPHFLEDDCFAVRKDGKVGVVSYKNKVLVPLEFDAMTAWHLHFAVYTIKDNKMGYWDFRSNFNIQPKYKSIKFESNFGNNYELFEVTKNGKKGYINRYGVEYFED